MARWCGALALLLLLAAAGCGGGGDESPPPATAERRQAALPPPAASPLDEARRRDRFCGALARIVDGEPAAFAPLRGAGAGAGAWDGREVPPGLRGCRVEGDRSPGASYVCRGDALSGATGDLLLPSYRALAAEIGRCLAQPIWYPSIWRQGQDFAFAGGERQTIWRDAGTGPKPAVALKIEEDLAAGTFHLRLAVAGER